ncbi:MAG: autotransporter domain-containing protein [Proteobacteria bacterium]|nr:autotransporter domain-containing protein [Pseudomonadota bacterium]
MPRPFRLGRQIGRFAAIGTGLVVLGSSGAWAQCANNGGNAAFAPFGRGTALSSFIVGLDATNQSSLAQSTAFVSTPPNAKSGDVGGGVWSREIAGTTEVKSHSTTTLGGSHSDCDVKTKMDFVGGQVGADLGRFKLDGTDVHFGATVGYFDVKAKDRTPGESTFSSQMNVPFMGAYLALQNGNFAVDAQARADFYRSSLTDGFQGLNGQEVDARTYAFLINASYRFDLQNKWFVEPSIGGVFSRTSVDNLNVAGCGFQGGVGAGCGTTATYPGTVSIKDIESTLGRASLRVGTTIVNGNMAYQPFAVGSVFHEFAGNVKATIEDSFGLLGGPASVSMSRVGTYGHVGLGIAAVVLDSGWLGYARVDYRFGDNVEGVSVNTGLRYQFSPGASVAGAGEGSLKDEAPKPVAYNWSGFYVGGMISAERADVNYRFTDTLNDVRPEYAGFGAGGQLGYNIQRDGVVYGFEADLLGSNARGGSSCPSAFYFTCNAELSMLSVIGGRVGLTWEKALFYVKGGLAIGEVTMNTKQNFAPFTKFPDDQTAIGWAFGPGVEFALNDRWSAKAEMLFYHLGKETYTVFPTEQADGTISGQSLRIGVNYHFGHHGEADIYEPMK